MAKVQMSLVLLTNAPGNLEIKHRKSGLGERVPGFGLKTPRETLNDVGSLSVGPILLDRCAPLIDRRRGRSDLHNNACRAFLVYLLVCPDPIWDPP